MFRARMDNPLHNVIDPRHVTIFATSFMSVSSYSVPGAVSAGPAWNPQQGMPQANIPPPGSAGGTGLGGRGAVGGGQLGPSRGDLTGDLCTTVDIFGGSANAAIWDERSSECKVSGGRLGPTVHFSAEGKQHLLAAGNQAGVKDIGAGVSVGGTNIPSSEVCYPLAGLLELDFVEGYGAVPAEPASSIPLPALVALLLDGAIALAAGAAQGAEVATKKGGKKSKRDRSLPSLTLISPAGFNQAQRAVLLKATEQSGRAVKNIFNRGVAVVAGSLYTASRAAAAASTGRSKGRVAVAGDLCDALGIQGEGCGSEEPLVLYLRVYALEGSAGKLYYDAALVRCEGSKGARQVGAPLGFERLCTAAALGGRLDESATDGKGILAAMSVVVVKLLLQAKSPDMSALKAVVLEGLISDATPGGKGPVDRSRTWSDADALGVLGRAKPLEEPAVVRAEPLDAVTGGCVLSAAELDSSKQYLLRQDGEWAIAYQLPVADGVVQGRDLVVKVQWEPDHTDIAPVLAVGTRLWKEDAGPIPPRSGSYDSESKQGLHGVFRMEFKQGQTTKIRVRSDTTRTSRKAGGDWPRVVIMERAGTAEDSSLRVLETLTPLLSVASLNDAEKDKAEAVESCVLEVRVDPSTGAVTATQSKGRSVSEAWGAFRGRLQLAFVLLLPFILIAAYYLSGHVQEWWVTRQHTAWLLDFYQKNAPEKLKDPEYVARTIAKYKGRMFLLWRNLERTYKVKWAPPSSIVDALGADDL